MHSTDHAASGAASAAGAPAHRGAAASHTMPGIVMEL
jgi:hypothetical protein